MDERLAHLQVTDPDGRTRACTLLQDRTTIGRLGDFNDIALEPDPQQLVTRKVHCIVERSAGVWAILDNGSVNGTFLRRNGAVQMVQGRLVLEDGDVVRILGRLSEEGEAAYWEVRLVDPQKTKLAAVAAPALCVEYDMVSATLSLIAGARRWKVALAPHGHKLIRYMAHRNTGNGGVPVLCSVEDLIEAVWESQHGPGPEDLRHVVWDTRKRVMHVGEQAGLLDGVEAPAFLEVEKGLGYRLRTCR